jgi:hypothetical protein
MKPTSFWRAMAGAGGQLREQGPCRNSDRPRRQQIFQMLAPAGGHPRNFNPRVQSNLFPALPLARSSEPNKQFTSPISQRQDLTKNAVPRASKPSKLVAFAPQSLSRCSRTTN